MRDEIEEKSGAESEAFKNLVFAHDVIPRNPGIYRTLYPEDVGLSEEEEAELEVVVPQTEGDVMQMIADLHATGWQGT